MRVLLTGADGYIGVVMGPKLIAAGHDVTGLDTGFYRRGWLFDDRATHPKVVSKDLRAVTVEDLAGFDAVVHLSELSNDPIGENDPELTMAINHRGSVGLAEKARAAGVRRFVYASSCSTYGAGGDEMRTEESALAPQTAYARCKILVETDVRALRDETFTPTFMRNATAYGASPAPALRHRPQQPLRLRPHHRRDPHDERRLAVAADRPHRGHLPGDDRGARRRPRGGRRRELQRRRRRRQLPHPRDRRDRGADLPGLRAHHRRGGRRHPQLSRLLRQDPQAPARSSRPPGTPSAAPASSRRPSTASASPARCSRPRPTPG